MKARLRLAFVAAAPALVLAAGLSTAPLPPASASPAARPTAAEFAEVFWSADRLAAVYPHRVDFFLLPEGVGAYFAEGARLRPVPETFPARGALRFYDAATVKAAGSHALFKVYEPGKPARLEPVKRMSFAHTLTTPPIQSARRDSFLVCTDPWLGTRAAKGDRESFCGALSLAGEILFEAPPAPGGREALEPLGLSPRADEAFFAVGELGQAREPKRMVRQYLLWTRAGGFKRIASHPLTPELRELLRRYIPEYYHSDPEERTIGPWPREREQR